MTKNILLYIFSIFTKSQHGKKVQIQHWRGAIRTRRPSSGDGKAPVRTECKIGENRRRNSDPCADGLEAPPDNNP